jgi:hypothetical protein
MENKITFEDEIEKAAEEFADDYKDIVEASTAFAAFRAGARVGREFTLKELKGLVEGELGVLNAWS